MILDAIRQDVSNKRDAELKRILALNEEVENLQKKFNEAIVKMYEAELERINKVKA